ncbi:MAG: hypothetical protein KGQ59_12100 [Bdellovibrionales bacterium]|nr:hypothetical protein [Bdellovibrionales bacterium]
MRRTVFLSLRFTGLLPLMAVFTLTSCGYALRTSKSPSRLSAEGVRRVYIHPVVNDTFKPGVENMVFNSVSRSLGGITGVHPTSQLALADAELFGTVVRVDRPVGGLTKASDLSPQNLGSPNILVAVEYQAFLNCRFELRTRSVGANVPKVLWSAEFSRSKPFPGNNQIYSLGSTSALINDSELDRALSDLAEQMGRDVAQSMLDVF